MRFDTNSQMWVDENGTPLLIQPPKPVGNDNGLNISANQNPINFNVPNFSNFNPSVRTSDGQMFNTGNFDFSIPNINSRNPQAPVDMNAIDKLQLSQMANFTQSTMDMMSPINNMDFNFQSRQQTPEEMYEEQMLNQNSTSNLNGGSNNNNGNGLFNALNNAGRTYSLESSLYGLGSALGKKDYTGMTEQEISRAKSNNTMSAIGNAGKLLLGGTRSLLSGASSAHMNNWNINEYRNKKRDALVNNQTGVENAYASIGGAPLYQEGGEIPLPPPVSSELEGNPNRVYDFRNEEVSDYNPAIMSRLTGRPYGFDFNSNVTNEAVNKAARLLAESRTNTPSEDNTTNVNTNYDALDFKTAFNQAYKDKGDGQVFNWKGKAYLLNKASEPNTSNLNRGLSNTSKNKTALNVKQTKTSKKDNTSKNIDPNSEEFKALKSAIFQDPNRLDEQGVSKYSDPVGEFLFDGFTFGIPRLALGTAKMVESGGKEGKMDALVGLANAVPLAGKLFTTPVQTIGILNGVNKGTEIMAGVNIGNNAVKTKIAQELINMAKVSKSPLTGKQLEMVNVAEKFLKGTSGGTRELPGVGRLFGKKPDITELYLGVKALEGTQRKKKYQDGGEVVEDDIISQLQMAVDSGEMTPEDAEIYLQQNQQPASEESNTPQGQDIQAQLMQAVQNGEMSEEEAVAYLQEMQGQPQPQQPQAPEQPQEQQPQISPDQAQEQLALAVQNGEMSEEEAQTYLQQLYGVEASSRPLEPYTGEVRENIKPEEYLTGEYTTGDENKPYNAEVEKDEYINRDGITQKVVGDKHSKGGEKMNLEAGTIIISDKGRIGAANAKALSLQTGLKLKAGDTYAQVIDIFTKKIGLEKLNKEQEDLFKKLEKVGDQGNQTTQDLNNSFLNAKINAIEDNKKQLLAQREQLTQVLFQLQEQNKDKSTVNEDLEKFQSGGMVNDPCAGLTGDARVQCVLKNYSAPKPMGEYGQLDTERQQIVPFLQEMGIDTPSNLDTYNQQQLGQLAGQAQQATNDYVSGHYGLYEAPTQSGLQWLVDKGLLKGNENFLKDIYKNGKITRGSYDTLNAEGKKAVANIVEGLDPKTQAEYGKSSYRDNAWYYRNPIVRNVDFDNEDEYNTARNTYSDLGDGNHYYSGSKGLYLKFNLNKPDNKDVDSSENVKSTDSPLNVNRSKRRSNAFLLPDQSTLPPEGLRAVPKYDIRYNYMDNIRLSPEQNLTENYRAYDEARSKMEGLPDVMNQANLAMLAGNVSQANNQAINQINSQNAQMAQQVAQSNLGILNRQSEMDLKLADQYDERMNRALDVTRKDLEGYYDFNRKVNVGEFNTRQQLTLLNDLFNNYGISPDGGVQFDPKTVVPFSVDGMEAIKYQRMLDEINKRNEKGTSSQKVVVKNRVSDNWNK